MIEQKLSRFNDLITMSVHRHGRDDVIIDGFHVESSILCEYSNKFKEKRKSIKEKWRSICDMHPHEDPIVPMNINTNKQIEQRNVISRSNTSCLIKLFKRRRRRNHKMASRTITNHLDTTRMASFLLATCLLIVTSSHPLQVSGQQVSGINEHQLVGRAGDQVQLPCLIGKPLYCGEVYFIAWYKMNGTSKSWVRIDQKSEEELATVSSDELASGSFSGSAGRQKYSWLRNAASSPTTPLGACLQHPKFAATMAKSVANPNAFPRFNGISSNNFHQQPDRFSQQQQLLMESNFECSLLTINSLEPSDEGQYKCDITFSETLDFDKCPATTPSQLLVIAQPNEPELLVNGRLVRGQTFEHSAAFGAAPATGTSGGASLSLAGLQQNHNDNQQLTFKEGVQIKLECQSSGGRPAPRIEWLNVSSLSMPSADDSSSRPSAGPLTMASDSDDSARATSGGQQPEVQLMRLHWPQKKLTYVDSSGNLSSGGGGGGGGRPVGQLITSSSVTFSLSRHDLRSRFVCLVIPQTIAQSQQQQQQQSTNDMPVRNLAQLGAMLNGHVGLHGSALGAPMLKWLKLNVQVKPSSVSLMVRDIESQVILQPIQAQPVLATSGHQQQQPPFYSLQPNKLYAIQCVVEGSRPQAQVSWFNRTAPVKIDQILLHSNTSDYQLSSSHHLISSFIRHYEQPNSGGTYRTIASLLISTKIWDNFEEFFCRVTNDAFLFDELTQVAPIISARLYVNYPPFAWLEADTLAPGKSPAIKWETINNNSINGQASSQQVGRLKVDFGERLTLRCHVAANPLIQNTILQIDWYKDGKRLTAAGSTMAANTKTTTTTTNNNNRASGLQIEKTNHLHMPAIDPLLAAALASANNNNKLLNGAATQVARLPASFFPPPSSTKLLATSSLTLGAATKLDSAAYSCQYKLIPAPQAPVTSLTQQQQAQIRITSGQANQTIQVQVIEAKSPTLRISASRAGLMVYGQQTSPPDGQRDRLTVVVLDPSALISLNCDIRSSSSVHSFLSSGDSSSASASQTGSRKVTWYLNGVYLHSSASTDTYNFTLDSLGDQLEKHLGLITCAHHTIESTGGGTSATQAGATFHGSQARIYQSTNELDLKLYIEPKLLERRDLMPTRRSFSDLELSANPGTKLKLVCLAQCEPLCSIDWYFERRHSQSGDAAAEPIKLTSEKLAKFRGDSAAAAAVVGATTFGSTDNPASNLTAKLVRWNYNELVVASDDNNDYSPRAVAATAATTTGQVFNPPLVILENLVNIEQDSRFSWLRETSLSQESHHYNGQHQRNGETSGIEMASRQLMRDAELNLNGGGVNPKSRANVFSKLELTYNQLGQLLGTSGSSGGSGGGGTGSESGSLFLADQRPHELHQQTASAKTITMTPTLAAQVAPQSRHQRADEIVIKCKLNTTFRGQPFGSGLAERIKSTHREALAYALVAPRRWFPAKDSPEANLALPTDGAFGGARFGSGNGNSESNQDPDGRQDATESQGSRATDSGTPSEQRDQFAMSNEQLTVPLATGLNLTSLSAWSGALTGGQASDMDLHSRRLLAAGSDHRVESDEMQISIFLDRPPRGASISFAGIISSDSESNGVQLTEAQLVDLLDANKIASPLLQCQAIGNPYPGVTYKWTFTDLASMQHPIETDGPEIDLRRLVEFRQRQLQANYGVDVIASIVGNYTCSVSNLHGSKSATMSFQVQGRPLCKLSLGREYLGAENEFMANLICSIYSMPQLDETLWVRNTQQIAVNKTILDLARGSLFSVELPIMVLNKQQDFQLTDLMTQTGNFKCIARNTMGYSEACELSTADKQTLLNTFKPVAGAPVARPPLSMLSFVDGLGKSPGATINFMANISGNIEPISPIGQHTPVGLVRGIYAHIDWIVIGICSLVLIYLTFIVASSIFRRRFSDPRKCLRGRSQHETSWRFNTNRRTSSNDDIGVTPITSRPFQSKVCVNYYSGSNGDSEKDMVQSCSQSSHYEEFMQTNQHQAPQTNYYHNQQKLIGQPQPQQPIYFNGNHAATLTRRPMKQSLSSSSTGGSSTGSRQGQQVSRFNTHNGQQQEQTANPIRINTSIYQFDQITSSGQEQPQTTPMLMGSTLRSDPIRNPHSTMTMGSNIPLITGSHNQSRINLDLNGNYSSTGKAGQPNGRFQNNGHQQRQQTFGGPQHRHQHQEHIYDDVIYHNHSQMLT